MCKAAQLKNRNEETHKSHLTRPNETKIYINTIYRKYTHTRAFSTAQQNTRKQENITKTNNDSIVDKKRSGVRSEEGKTKGN